MRQVINYDIMPQSLILFYNLNYRICIYIYITSVCINVFYIYIFMHVSILKIDVFDILINSGCF